MDKTHNSNGIVHRLALKAKSGDRDALEKLLIHQELKGIIYKIANEKVGLANADDVYQEVLTCISQKIHTWQGQTGVIPWISRITRNTCVDVLRKIKPYQMIITDTPPERSSEPEQFHRVSIREMMNITRNILGEMAEECQQLLRAYIIEGLDKSEIMEIARLPKSTFHRKWKGCYETLTKKIQNFCKHVGKK